MRIASREGAGRRARIWAALALWPFALSVLASTAGGEELEEPCTGSSDWVQLKSSEWLKGELRRMRYGTLEFWSLEMKSRRIRWRKVAVLCTAKQARFVTLGYTAFTGRGVVQADQVTVETDEGTISFPREELTAILPRGDRERDKWGVRVGFGANANIGNTEQSALNLSGGIRREDRYTRGEIYYEGAYGSASGVENVNRHRIVPKLDWFIGRRVYWALVDSPLVHDKFLNIDARLAPSTGVGFRIFDRSGLDWSIEAGAGYQYTSFISVTRGEPSQANDMVVRLATDLSVDIIPNLELILDHDTTIVPTDIGLTTLYTRLALEYELTWLLKLQTAVIHNRIFEPRRRADGTLPRPDDLQVIVGLTLDSY